MTYKTLKYSLPYGEKEQPFEIADAIKTDFILPAHFPAAEDPVELIKSALNAPIGFSWPKLGPEQKVAIAINDKTRPVPHDVILPTLLEFLGNCGIRPRNIHFWIATGTHLPIPEAEYRKIIPQSVADHYAVSSHDINDLENLVWIGKTSFETDVWVNQRFYHADLKIVVGNIEPHHFAGFSGGMKTAAIGLSGRDTINHNHAMLAHPDAWIGKYENNPLRQDIEEIGKLIGVNLALNVVMNQDQQVADVFAGEPRAVMEAGIPRAKQICGVRCDTAYDLVVASAGGHPKDINFYQAQKALTHASLFAKPGAPIILASACPEGSGSAAYERLLAEVHSIEEIFAYFQSHPFQVGPHKALQVARILQRNPVILVSELPSELVRRMLLTSKPTLQEAVDAAVKEMPEAGRIVVLPHATTTLPV